MRKGIVRNQQGKVGIAIALAILTAMSAITATRGLHITAGDIVMSMDVNTEKGLLLRFGKASDV